MLHSCTNASICCMKLSPMHQQGKDVRRVQYLMLCQLGMNCTTKTLARLLLVSMGNFMAWSSFWFWLGVSSNYFIFSLVSISVFMVNVKTIGRHLSRFPLGRADGGLPLFDMDIQGCQLLWFPLIWRNNW
jgi:hypothetical protein